MENIFWSIIRRLMHLGRGVERFLNNSLKESLDEAVLKRLNLNLHLSESRCKILIQTLCLNLRTQMLTAWLLPVLPGGVYRWERLPPPDCTCWPFLSLWELVLSYHCVGSGYWAGVITWVRMCSYILLSSPHMTVPMAVLCIICRKTHSKISLIEW